FPSVAACEREGALDDPGDAATFRKSILDVRERASNATAYALHRDLLRLRREDPIFAAQGRFGIDGSVLSNAAFALRYFSDGYVDDRVVLVNLGGRLRRGGVAPTPPARPRPPP